MDEENRKMNEDKEPVYTEEEWEAVRDGLRRHDEEKLSGLICGVCGHRYRVGEEEYKYCPTCGFNGPGHPDAELVDLPEGGRRH